MFRKSPASHRWAEVVVALVGLSLVLVPVGCTSGTGDPADENLNRTPVMSLELTPTTGQCPCVVTAKATVAYDDGSPFLPTASGISWGYNANKTVVGYQDTYKYTYTSPGVKTVTVWVESDASYETAQATAQIEVLPADNREPTVSLSVDEDLVQAPGTVRFTGEGADPDGEIAEWSLDYGDGSAPTVTTIAPSSRAHTYTDPGTYTAVLTVTDDRGATASASVSVDVL